jgi:hypothetical protein
MKKAILDKGFQRLAKVYKTSQNIFDQFEDELDPSMVVDDEYANLDAEELVLFIQNDGELYQSQTTPMIKNLLRKMNSGVFDYDKSVQLWMYLVDAGAKKYVQDLSIDLPWHKAFPKAVRQEAAQLLADDFRASYEMGEFEGFGG